MKKITCIGCSHHYISPNYLRDYQLNDYTLTDSWPDSFNRLELEEEHIPKLISLMQYYLKFIKKTKATLSEGLTFQEYNSSVNYNNISNLAKLAFEINETAQKNKKNKANLSE